MLPQVRAVADVLTRVPCRPAPRCALHWVLTPSPAAWRADYAVQTTNNAEPQPARVNAAAFNPLIADEGLCVAAAGTMRSHLALTDRDTGYRLALEVEDKAVRSEAVKMMTVNVAET